MNTEIIFQIGIVFLDYKLLSHVCKTFVRNVGLFFVPIVQINEGDADEEVVNK